MIGLLARRTLTDRPRRTLLLLCGFGISVGVMIVLLSIGQAVLEQARDKDVVGGGDVVILPEGVDVEVMKLGGATGMFFSIDNARFVYRQVLSGPRYSPWVRSIAAPAWPQDRIVARPAFPQDGLDAAPPLAAASPALSGKLVYLRKRVSGQPIANPIRATASGIVPSLERAVNGGPQGPGGVALEWKDTRADSMWIDPPPDSLYAEMDRFHVPPAGIRDADSWAEWLYFNFTEPETGVFGFLSLIVSGDPTTGRARGHPLLQIVRPGEQPERYDGDVPLGAGAVSTERVHLRFGTGTEARFEGGAWRLRLDWQSPRGAVRGELDVEPVPDLYFPPFLIHSDQSLVSGYTVPALRASADGWIEAGGRRIALRRAPAYHDHNWGTWRNVRWDWGAASTPDHGLLYGRVEHPDLQPGRAGSGIFLLLLQARAPGQRGGYVALVRPDSITYTWRTPAGPLPGAPRRVPETIALRWGRDGSVQAEAGRAPRTDVGEVQMQVEQVLSTPWRAPEPVHAAELGSPGVGAADLVFLQLHGRYTVRARTAGSNLELDARGFAEVFVPPAVVPPR